jgi:hypothetical protein
LPEATIADAANTRSRFPRDPRGSRWSSRRILFDLSVHISCTPLSNRLKELNSPSNSSSAGLGRLQPVCSKGQPNSSLFRKQATSATSVLLYNLPG